MKHSSLWYHCLHIGHSSHSLSDSSYCLLHSAHLLSSLGSFTTCPHRSSNISSSMTSSTLLQLLSPLSSLLNLILIFKFLLHFRKFALVWITDEDSLWNISLLGRAHGRRSLKEGRFLQDLPNTRASYQYKRHCHWSVHCIVIFTQEDAVVIVQNKNKIRNWVESKNIQHRVKFTGSYKKSFSFLFFISHFLTFWFL